MASKIVVTLGTLLLCNTFVDWKNPLVVNIVRGAFAVLCVATYLAWQRITAAVEEAKDANSSPVWVVKKAPGAAGLLATLMGDAAATPSEAGAVVEYEQTTVYEIEKKKAATAAAAATSAPLMPLLMSMQFNIHLPMAMQLVSGPLAAWDDVLVKKYLLGFPVGPTPHGELTEEPKKGIAAVSASPIAGDGVSSSGSTKTQAVAASDVEIEEAIMSVWEAPRAAPVSIAVFEVLRAASRDINYRTVEGGWTALMVVSGNASYTGADVRRLIGLGADPAVTDADGWTALHWAGYHNVAEAVDAIVGAYGTRHGAAAAGGLRASAGDADDLKALLKCVDAKGRTALDVAVEAGEENAAVAAALRAAMARAGLSTPAAVKDATATAASEEDVAAGAGTKDHDGLRHRAHNTDGL